MTFGATGEDAGGAYSLADSAAPPQGGPPPRANHREGGAFRALEGELEASVGGSRFGSGAGPFVRLPRGVLRSYQSVGAAPAGFAKLVVPAGSGKCFGEAGKPGTRLASPPPFGEDDLDRILAAAPKYGVEIPPPREP